MPAPFRHGITVYVRRPGGVDRFGDPDPGSPATMHTLSGCSVSPRTSSEDNNRGDTVIIGLTLMAAYDADLGAADRIELPDGSTYEVEGEPGRWQNPLTGRKFGLSAALKRVTG